jgi:farnesyl-diphosphate farnesyltransferase
MADDLFGELLRQVSRSFYLSLRILPRGVREPLGLAYLLARAADTVADTRLIARRERLDHLETLRAAFRGAPADLSAVARAAAPYQTLAAERRLLERVADAVTRLRALPATDRHAVSGVLDTLTSGMVFDLTRFPGDDARALAALYTLDELDHYTYLVAGCVGPFWTAVHVAHRPRLRGWDVASRSAQAIAFGKALQMTNVLRDVAGDLAHGRCYVPARELAAVGLRPADLREPAPRQRARARYDRLLAHALSHYDQGWSYTLAIPVAEWRMRLACVWPLAIGLATLDALATHPDPMGAPSPIKISRAQVRGLLARSTLVACSNRGFASLRDRLRRRIVLPDAGATAISRVQ